jgi:hypothetical protein
VGTDVTLVPVVKLIHIHVFGKISHKAAPNKFCSCLPAEQILQVPFEQQTKTLGVNYYSMILRNYCLKALLGRGFNVSVN